MCCVVVYCGVFVVVLYSCGVVCCGVILYCGVVVLWCVGEPGALGLLGSLGIGVLGSWEMGCWGPGDWVPGVLGSWGLGVLGSCVLGSWGAGVLGSWGMGSWGHGVLGSWGVGSWQHDEPQRDPTTHTHVTYARYRYKRNRLHAHLPTFHRRRSGQGKRKGIPAQKKISGL